MMRKGECWRAAVVAVAAGLALGGAALGGPFASDWPAGVARVWIGPQYYADRLQDWRLRHGRVECIEAGRKRPMRVLHLLAADASDAPGTLRMRVRLGPVEPDGRPRADSWAGFLLGAGGPDVDYRLTALVHGRAAPHGGLAAVVDAAGRVTLRDNERRVGKAGFWTIGKALADGELAELGAARRKDRLSTKALPEIVLELEAHPAGTGYALVLTARDAAGALLSRAEYHNVAPALVDGGVGLVSHRAPTGGKRGWWFRDWQVAGDKVRLHADRRFGPVAGVLYTLSRGTLKLTAQMLPIGQQDSRRVTLEVRRPGQSDWTPAATATIDADGFTARFRVEHWEATADVPFRVVYRPRAGGETYTCAGTIRREPIDEDELVLAAFTGTKHYTGRLRWDARGIWFPHADLVRAVAYHDPDILFFSGDQVYEGDITGAERRPIEVAMLDYLDKWYRWCWAFGDLTRERPCICIPDDHDVYQGNIWGAGGRKARRQDDGGYIMPPRWVNMVQRTQTSHLPDPFDPTPVEQGIGVYYTSVNYAGLSLAILEDRKFKSSPTVMVPAGRVKNGWFRNPDFDPATQADVPGAVLLGERQLRFLRHWAADFSGGTWMKVALSQTIFANVATIPPRAASGSVLVGLETPAPGEYPQGYKLAADADSGGWPQSGRNRALRELRRGFALHVAGDQHLGSFIHYGVEDFDDAGYGFCVPSIANAWPRRWFPPAPGAARRPGDPPYCGRFRDGFGNRMTVLAVSNPCRWGHEPARLHDHSPGYGIVRFRRATREIVVECWPRWADPARPGARQYPGWPITIHQLDNYGRRPAAWLPAVEVGGLRDPVVQVIRERDGVVVYTLRIRGTSWRPMVFEPGSYALRIGEPDRDLWKTLRGVRAGPRGDETILRVDFTEP